MNGVLILNNQKELEWFMQMSMLQADEVISVKPYATDEYDKIILTFDKDKAADRLRNDPELNHSYQRFAYHYNKYNYMSKERYIQRILMNKTPTPFEIPSYMMDWYKENFIESY